MQIHDFQSKVLERAAAAAPARNAIPRVPQNTMEQAAQETCIFTSSVGDSATHQSSSITDGGDMDFEPPRM